MTETPLVFGPDASLVGVLTQPDDDTRASVAHRVVDEHGIDGRVRLRDRGRHDHPFAGSKSIGLDHDGRALRGDVGTRGGGVGVRGIGSTAGVEVGKLGVTDWFMVISGRGGQRDQRLRNMLNTKLAIASTMNTTNRICAMLAAPAEMPVKPNKAAISAMTKKTTA